MSEKDKGGRMQDEKGHAQSCLDSLFQRVVVVLDQARSNVARSANTNMVLAYWLFGHEIVQELQGGQERAEYGKQIIENLSARLTERYGRGFSTTNLWYFRQFFQVYSNRMEILHPPGGELISTIESRPSDEQSQRPFSPLLSWSHYRALRRVQDTDARDFYEREAAECGWTKSQLERQIQSSYFQRIIANRGKAGLVASDR